MKLNLLKAENPRWTDKNKTSITLDVLFKEHVNTYGILPFNASPNDVEEHGRKIFEDAKAGKFGKVADAPEKSINELEFIRKMKINSITSNIESLERERVILQDSVDIGIATESEGNRLKELEYSILELKKTRIELSRLDLTVGEDNIKWP